MRIVECHELRLALRDTEKDGAIAAVAEALKCDEEPPEWALEALAERWTDGS